MWSYPAQLDPSIKPFQHIPAGFHRIEEGETKGPSAKLAATLNKAGDKAAAIAKASKAAAADEAADTKAKNIPKPQRALDQVAKK